MKARTAAQPPAPAEGAGDAVVRILMLEDSDMDAELTERALRRSGLPLTMRRVETRPAFETALAEFRPQAVIADFNLPHFNGREALDMVQRRCPEVPVIVVSGALGDEQAVDLLKAGACDFVLKDRPARLASALKRALADAEDRRRRLHAEQAMLKGAQRFRAMIENVADVVEVLRPDGTILYASPAVKALTGFAPEEVIGRNVGEFLDERGRALAAAALLENNRRPGVPLETEVRFQRRDGAWIDVQAVSVNRSDIPEVRGIILTLRDITGRKAQEARILRLNRTHAVLSEVNSLIVRTRTRAELFQEACRIVVEAGGYRLAWIGTALGGSDVRPVVHHGDDRGLLRDLSISVSEDGPNGRGCTARALRSGQPEICGDAATDSVSAPLREALAQAGLHAFAALPLTARERVSGCLNIYATEQGVFDHEEMQLLSQVAANLSYALEFIVKDEQLDFLALYDPVTRLPNRTLFAQRLARFVDVAKERGEPLAVLMLSIERLRTMNELVGRSAGDEVLKQTAERIKQMAGGPSYMAYLGDDRFFVVLRDLEGPGALSARLADEKWGVVDQAFTVACKEFRPTFTVGAAQFPEDAGDAQALMDNAESALKEARAKGLRHARYTPELGTADTEGLRIESALRSALRREEFVLHYQPKVDLHSSRICGAEALIRWEEPGKGLVYPDRFIPALEQSGLILDVGKWVLERAVNDSCDWAREGLTVPRLSVNVSQAQLQRGDFVEILKAALADRACAVGALELEITESMIMVDVDGNIARLRAVRELGVSIALDDFGTGYSSLAALARLPLNIVKIPQPFIERMTEDADTMSIVSAIITLAHSMSLKVVAEGVETAEQLTFLRLLKCDEVQGYALGKPMPGPAFAALLRAGGKVVPQGRLASAAAAAAAGAAAA